MRVGVLPKQLRSGGALCPLAPIFRNQFNTPVHKQKRTIRAEGRQFVQRNFIGLMEVSPFLLLSSERVL